MFKRSSPQKFITLFSASILLSMLTIVMGSPLMRVLRKSYGPLAYWFAGVAVTALFWLLKAEPAAVFIGSVWMTLGVYGELEQKGFGWWLSGVLGVLSGSILGGFGMYKVFELNGVRTITELQASMDKLFHEVTVMNPQIKLDTVALAQQIPSAFIIIMILALGLGLIFERRIFSWLNLPREKVASQLKLLEYRVPDVVIWIAMSAFLLTMVSSDVKVIAILALNIVNVAVVLYFFQGVAVLEVFLNSIRAGTLVRVLIYIILIGQLFLLLSLVGLIDYWVDFRKRINNLKSRMAENS